jgi:N utilization substance protein B
MRRHGRECALQILYQMDMQSLLTSVDEASRLKAIADFWGSFDKVGPDDRRFATRLVDGVIQALEDLDKAIEGVSHRWKMGRMAQVDRNLLRMAAYEILYCPDIPKSATINEAIEVAKRFSGQDSFAFINGILDKLEPESDDA